MRTLLLLLLCGSLHAQVIDPAEVFASLNAERAKHKKPPLEYKSEYQSSCDAWAQKISTSLVHSRAKYRGETISECPGSDELIVPLFMLSKPHKETLLDKKATGACIGIYHVPADTVVNGSSITYNPPIYYAVIRTY